MGSLRLRYAAFERREIALPQVALVHRRVELVPVGFDVVCGHMLAAHPAQHRAVRFIVAPDAAGVVLGPRDILHHEPLHVVRVLPEDLLGAQQHSRTESAKPTLTGAFQ
jgi:hypothetical protein